MSLRRNPLLLLSFLPLALSGRNPFLNSLKDFLSARAGPNSSPAVWHVRGTFSNPNTGDVFARVEGVEVSRLVNFAKGSQKKIENSIEGMKLSLLIKEQGKEPWDAAGLVLSHKAYWLLDPGTQTPMTHYRANPRSRRKGRPVPSLTKYSQAIAYLLRGPKLTICSQLTDGSTLTAEADPPIPQKNNNFNPFPFSRSYEVKYTMWPGAHRPMLAWSLVQFGSAPSTPACRESYSFERKWLGGGNMRYVRYGEAPWWYGAGRICKLELEGTRLDSLNELPRNLKRRIKENEQANLKKSLQQNWIGFKESSAQQKSESRLWIPKIFRKT